MTKRSTVVIDGMLYCSIGLFTFLQGYFTSDDSYKYISPLTLFWIKCVVGGIASVTGSLKMFRSRTFADGLDSEKPQPTQPVAPQPISPQPQPELKITKQ